jgi:hypothetical protein
LPGDVHCRALRENTFEGKLKRLLAFYEANIPAERAVLLGIVAMFRSPVGAATIFRLARGLPKARDVFAKCDDRALDEHLRGLVREHLLVREPSERGEDGYTCHPVLRDHFRAALLGKDPQMAAEAAGMLTEQPSRDGTQSGTQSVAEIEPVLVAIELLLEAGKFDEANDLYMFRLDNGNLFLHLPAPHEGMQCALGFVASAGRREHCEASLYARRFGFYLNEVGLYGMNCGEHDLCRIFLCGKRGRGQEGTGRPQPVNCPAKSLGAAHVSGALA